MKTRNYGNNIKQTITDYNKNNTSDITFNVDGITIIVHSPSITTTEEDNKKQLAKYLYKLAEMNNKVIQ